MPYESYDFMQCCKYLNIKEECRSVCGYNYNLNFLAFDSPCYSEINKVMACIPKGFNYQNCCQVNGIPEDCLGLCNNEAELQKINVTICAAYIKNIVTCFEERPCNPDEYNNRFCEKDNNFESCGYYDEGDCQLPNTIVEWSECPHNSVFIGDGICDNHLKDKSECNHDGGDCCDDSLRRNKICNGFNNFKLTECAIGK